jgi:hypothetical protein
VTSSCPYGEKDSFLVADNRLVVVAFVVVGNTDVVSTDVVGIAADFAEFAMIKK